MLKLLKTQKTDWDWKSTDYLPASGYNGACNIHVCVHATLSVRWCPKALPVAVCEHFQQVKTRAEMSATGSRGVRRAPPDYVHPPPPVRPYANVHQADDRSLGDIQLEERGKRGGGKVERPDLNSFTTKKSVSAGEQISILGIFIGPM